MATCAEVPETPGDLNATSENKPDTNHGNDVSTTSLAKANPSATTEITRCKPPPATPMKASRDRRPVSMPPGDPTRKRASYHQDVEEALSSLLWQPYEYRTQSDSSDTLSTLSISTGSSSSTSLSYEYAVVKNNALKAGGSALLHSFTDEFLNVATLSARPQMVTNLSAGVGSQSARSSALSQVDSAGCARSRVRELVSRASVSAVSDDDQVSEMRVEIPGEATDLMVSANVVGLPPTNPSSVCERVPPLPNVSNVNVNYYRAVPVNILSNVPTIQCVNHVEEGNNVSSVHIVQAMPITQPSISTVRTFTSTEAQTDDTTVGLSPTVIPAVNREQRRRERRERRHQRRLNNTNHPHQSQPQSFQTQSVQTQNVQTVPTLPDLLNSHLPPPYSTLPNPNGGPPLAVVGPPPPPPMVPFPPVGVGVVPVVPATSVPVPQPTGFRFPFPNANGFRRCRSRLGPRYSTEEHQPKSCCGFLVSRPGSLRWFIALIALVAVCCVLVGTVLGAMRPAGRDHLTVSLLMIGVGIVLVTVSGVAWRLTSHDAPSCRAMLGLDSSESADVCTRRFVPRLPPSYGRPHHPYAAMIYPEFQYRPPPPSYQASMQEYRLRLLLLDRGREGQQVVSPPPTYRSHAGSLLRAPLSNRRDASQSEYSCPPSYRSRTSTNRQPSVDPVVHSREQSLSLSESNPDGSVVNVVNILANQEEEIALENMTLDSLKVAPENEIPPLRMLLKSGSGSDLENKDGNLVTIVQKADQNPVIVTVSGSHMSTANPEVGSSHQIPSEMEILAHL